VSHVPDGDPARAAAAAALAALGGVELDGWQRMVLDACLRRSEGRYCAFETVLIVPRQNGKSVVLGIRALAGALLFGERLVIVSAHEWRTVVELFRAADDLLAGSPLRKQVRRVRRTGGEESIEFTGGARVRFMNRSKESARGFSADTVIMDEAHTVTGEQMAALLPVMSARPDPQVVYACAGPGPQAWHLSRLRQRVLTGDTRRLAWLEWSADPDGDTEDEQAWLAANPAAASGRLQVDRMREERASLGFDGFRAERLACAPWPSELDNAFGVFSPEDVREMFGRSA
jgi:phage terminase large subunit-like protein